MTVFVYKVFLSIHNFNIYKRSTAFRRSNINSDMHDVVLRSNSKSSGMRLIKVQYIFELSV